MPQVNCPACSRALSVPDNMIGMQVRCPMCSHVFQAGAPAGAPAPTAAYQPPQPPPQRPAPPPGYDRPPPRQSGPVPPPDEDYGRDQWGERGHGDSRARAVAGGAAGWMLAAAIVDTALAGLSLLGMLITGGTVSGFGGRGDAVVAAILMGLLCVLIVIVTPTVFIFIGSSMLRNLRGKGMVITGCVMAFVLSAFMLLGALASLINIAETSRYRGGAAVVVLLVMLVMYLAAIAVNVTAGIRALIAMGNPAVKNAYR